MSSIKSWFVESNTGRMRALWRILLGYLLMFAVIAVLSVTVDAIEIPWIESFLWQVLAVPVLIFIARLLARRVDRRRFEEYGLTWDSRAFRHLAVGAFAGVLLVSIVFLAGFVSGAIKVVSIAHTSYEIPWVLTFAGFGVRYASVAVFEELFNRGFLIINLVEAWPAFGRHAPMVAVFVSSAVFGALHLTNDHATPLAALNIFLLGALFAVVFVRAGSLWGAIGLHFTWNFMLGNIYGLPVSGYYSRTALLETESVPSAVWTGGAFGPEGSLIVTGVSVVAIAVAFILLPNRGGNTRAHLRAAAYRC